MEPTLLANRQTMIGSDFLHSESSFGQPSTRMEENASTGNGVNEAPLLATGEASVSDSTAEPTRVSPTGVTPNTGNSATGKTKAKAAREEKIKEMPSELILAMLDDVVLLVEHRFGKPTIAQTRTGRFGMVLPVSIGYCQQCRKFRDAQLLANDASRCVYCKPGE